MGNRRIQMLALVLALSALVALASSGKAEPEIERKGEHGLLVSRGEARAYLVVPFAEELQEVKIFGETYIGPADDGTRRLTYVVKIEGLPVEALGEDVVVQWKWRPSKKGPYRHFLDSSVAKKVGNSFTQSVAVKGTIQLVDGSVFLLPKRGSGYSPITQAWMVAAVPAPVPH